MSRTLLCARRFSWFPKQTSVVLPSFKAHHSSHDEKTLINDDSHKGLEKRLVESVYPRLPFAQCADKDEARRLYGRRLDYELDVICRMGFAGYFLIVADFIRWARSQAIAVGPGRGSGAGSMAAWCLGITDLDPIRFGLLFERFLNPERVSMPDFDIDFCQQRRDDVIRYVRDRFGAERVAHIMTFGRLKARAALRDVGRVLKMRYERVDSICKLVPQQMIGDTPLSVYC